MLRCKTHFYLTFSILTIPTPETSDLEVFSQRFKGKETKNRLLLAERRIPLSSTRFVGQSLDQLVCSFLWSLRNATPPGV